MADRRVGDPGEREEDRDEDDRRQAPGARGGGRLAAHVAPAGIAGSARSGAGGDTSASIGAAGEGARDGER